KDPEEWKTIRDPSCMWRLALLALAISASLVFRTLARDLVNDTQTSWSLDIWSAHVPFWTAVIGRLFTAENLVYSMGTSLGATCGLVLMVPVDVITHKIVVHIYSVLYSISVAVTIVLAHQILNKLDKSKDRHLTPLH